VSPHNFDERFLVLTPTGRDGPLTQSLLNNAGLQSAVCQTIDELCESAERHGVAGLLIAEEVLVPSAVARLTELLSRQKSWSDLPILLFTGEGATIQASPPTIELLTALGNVTLIERPVRPITMVTSAQSALRTRRRQYAARAELLRQQRAVRQRDQFLAMLGHELRNPLSAITMALELMTRENKDAQEQHSIMQRSIMQRQTELLTRLVDDLLEVSRLNSGKIVLHRAPMNLIETVQRAIDAAQARIMSQNLRLTVQMTEKEAVMDGDPVRIEQIVTNLLTNAIKYTPEGGAIEISVTVENNRGFVRFKDSGVGISDDMLPRIFELFEQAEDTLDRSKGGMGIGLTLVKSLVELHGGTVHAKSPGIDKGSTFTVELPLLPTAVLPDTASNVAKATSKGRARHVLIVEDNKDSREMLQEILESYGHHVEAAEDGLSGIKRALQMRPEVLVVDIGLPGLDGYSMARRVRAELGEDVYMIALTGYGQPEDRQLALDAGFDIHFTKPINLSAVQQLLNQPDLHRK